METPDRAAGPAAAQAQPEVEMLMEIDADPEIQILTEPKKPKKSAPFSFSFWSKSPSPSPLPATPATPATPPPQKLTTPTPVKPHAFEPLICCRIRVGIVNGPQIEGDSGPFAQWVNLAIVDCSGEM